MDLGQVSVEEGIADLGATPGLGAAHVDWVSVICKRQRGYCDAVPSLCSNSGHRRLQPPRLIGRCAGVIIDDAAP
jgi:hypothetical protein